MVKYAVWGDHHEEVEAYSALPYFGHPHQTHQWDNMQMQAYPMNNGPVLGQMVIFEKPKYKVIKKLVNERD